jgi:hypothetical protein
MDVDTIPLGRNFIEVVARRSPSATRPNRTVAAGVSRTMDRDGRAHL